MSSSAARPREAAVVVIRPATPADAPAISVLEGLSASTLRLLDHDLAQPDRRCLVAATVDGHRAVMGYAAAILQDTDAHVIDIAVDPARRRQGIGRRLLDALVAAVYEAGVSAVTLEVRSSNLGSQGLYRQLGFVDEGRRPRYYPDGEDALIWWLRRDAAADQHDEGRAHPAEAEAGRAHPAEAGRAHPAEAGRAHPAHDDVEEVD